MRRNHTLILLIGLCVIFVVLFLLLYFLKHHKPFPPRPPMVDYRFASSDSLSYTNTLFYNFDNVTQKKLFSKTHAHSGKYAIVAKGKGSYSPVIQKPLSELPVLSIGEANIGAWVYSTDKKNISGKFMFQITDKLNSVKYSYAITLNEISLPTNEWIYISGKVDLSEYLFKSTDIIKIYYLNQCEAEVFIDDVMLVFGKQQLKGNYPFTDITAKNNKYIPQTNQPPYPTYFTRNTSSQYLINNVIKNGRGNDSIEIKPGDNLIPGHFIPSGNTSEQVLLIRDNVPHVLIRFLKDRIEFTLFRFEMEIFSNMGAKDSYVAADINADGRDEFICFSDDNHSADVVGFNPSANKAEMIFRGNIPIEKCIVKAARLSTKSSKNEYLFALDATGNAYLLNFEKNKWNIRFIANISEANQQYFMSTLIGGTFKQAGSNDNVLLLSQNRNSGRCFYKLLEVDPQAVKISTIYEGNFDNKCDTLYPDNTYFVSDTDGDGADELISYGSSWRFELKMVSFTDKGYHILSNIDFKGYEKDHNPKYYENLTLCAGQFTDSNTLYLFMMCSNNSKISDLPDVVGLYSLSFTRQKDSK